MQWVSDNGHGALQFPRDTAERMLQQNDPAKETPFYVFKNKGILGRRIIIFLSRCPIYIRHFSNHKLNV